MPLVDNNGHSSAGFDVMCRQAAPRPPRAMHPQMIVHRLPTLWPAPSQMASGTPTIAPTRRDLSTRSSGSPGGPPGLARYETLVNAEDQETTTIGDAPLEDVPDETEVVTFAEQDEPNRPDVITFEEQDTRSLLRPEDEDPRSNVDVNTSVVGLITDCTGDFDAIAGLHGSAAMCREELLYNADVNTNVVGLITDCTGDFGTTAGVLDSAAVGGVCNLVSSSGNLQEKGTLPRKLSPRTSHQTQKVVASSRGSMNSRCFR